VEWTPSSGFTPVVEYEVHPVFSGSIEYGVVTTQEPKSVSNAENDNTNEPPKEKVSLNPYVIHFNVEDISSIRRSDPRLAWSYVLFVMKDEHTQPALHFHSGGIKEMISMLQRYIWLTRSPVNNRLFIVKEKDDAMESALNQFELFTDKPSGAISKLFNNTFYDTLNNFAKVTNYVLSGMGQHDLQERRPERTGANSSKKTQEDDEFEFLTTEQEDLTGTIIPVAREDPLRPEEWCAFIDDNGMITNLENLKERIFRGGVHEDIKCEAWKYLLGYHKFDSTYEERCATNTKKREDYMRMKLQWQSITREQEAKFSEFAQRKHLVEKDTDRTDRKLEFYAGDDNPNVKKLFNILLTYCMFNFDLGYVQGMSDLLAPILRLLGDEVESFWCFVGLMEMEEKMFEISQDLMKTQLENLGKLIKYLYPHFWTYLERHEAQNLYFCFRWLLISFKREFEYNDVMTIWEALWTNKYSSNFKLFISCAILEREKDEMMKRKYDFNDILKHVNKLSGQIDVSYVLARAESICLQLQQTEDLPEHIKVLINQSSVLTTTTTTTRQEEPDAGEKVNCHSDASDSQAMEDTLDRQAHEDTTDRQANEDTTDRQAHSEHRNINERVVELKENTDSVF